MNDNQSVPDGEIQAAIDWLEHLKGCWVGPDIHNLYDLAIAALRAYKPEPCEWAADEDGIWHSKCGSTWILTDGGPAENKMVFCMKCGKRIEVKELEEEIDEM